GKNTIKFNLRIKLMFLLPHLISFFFYTAVLELISNFSSLWSTGVMLFLGGFLLLLTSIGGPMNLWIRSKFHCIPKIMCIFFFFTFLQIHFQGL
ncbi:hypothetical protein L9F63_010262, partial [Diploptera punctata]